MRVIKKTRTPKGTLKWVVEYERKLLKSGTKTQTYTLYACSRKEMIEHYKQFKANNEYYNKLIGCKKEPERLAYL